MVDKKKGQEINPAHSILPSYRENESYMKSIINTMNDSGYHAINAN